MAYDPNDPNQDSQRPEEVVDPTTGAKTNQATAQMNDFGAYMRSHPGWTPTPQQLAAINAQLKDGTIKPNDPSYLPLYLMAAAMAAGPVAQAVMPTTGGAISASTATAAAPASAAGGTTAAAGGSTGILGTIFKAAPALSDIFSKAAGSDVKQSNDSDALKLALQNAGINAKKLAVTAPGQRLATGERAALAKVATPAEVHWGGPGSGLRGEVPTYTGGIKSIYEANQDPTMKALHDLVLQDSLVGQQKGGATGGNDDASLGSAANVGEGSKAGDVLGAVGMGTSVMAALEKLGIFGKGPTPTSPMTDNISD